MLRAPPPRTRVVPNGSEVWTIFKEKYFYDFLGQIFGSFDKQTLLIFQQQKAKALLCPPAKHDENVCVAVHF